MSEDFLGLFRNSPEGITLNPGEVLFNKGDSANGMYVLKSGEVSILDGNHVFETISPGGIFGEMALISKEPRSAAVRANVRSEVIPVDEQRFLLLVQATPFFAIRVMRVMSGRLKAMNDRLVSLPK